MRITVLQGDFHDLKDCNNHHAYEDEHQSIFRRILAFLLVP